jgi:general transcription factor 3C polypeptide 3 (transcription factor C subunit 4)
MAQPQSQYPDPEMSEMVGPSWIGQQEDFQQGFIDRPLKEADSLQDKNNA